MVAVIDISGSARAERFRSRLINYGIPSIYSDDPTSELSRRALVYVFFIDTVKYYESFLNETDMERVLYFDGHPSREAVESERVHGRIIDVLDVKYGLNPDSVCEGRYGDYDGEQSYGNRVLALSQAQRLVAKYLVWNHVRWCSCDEIVAFCFSEEIGRRNLTDCIFEINEKSRRAAGLKMIKNSRVYGYRFSPLKKPRVITVKI